VNPDQSNRDLQRGALEQLVELTSQCVARENKLDTDFRSLHRDAESKSARAAADLDRNYRAVQEQIGQKSAERQEQIQSRFQQNIASIRGHDVSIRKSARTEFDAVQRRVKEKYDQAVWLAESVLEASDAKVAAELKQAHELHASQDELLNSKDVQVRTLLDRYSFTPPPKTEAEKQALDPNAPVDFNQLVQTGDEYLQKMAELGIPNYFVGAGSYLTVFAVLAIAAAAPQAIAQTMQPQWIPLAIWVGSAVVLLTVFLLMLRAKGRRQILEAYLPLRDALEAARWGNERMLEQAKIKHDTDAVNAQQMHNSELQNARDMANPILETAKKKMDSAAIASQQEMESRLMDNEAQRRTALAELEQWQAQKLSEYEQKYQAEQTTAAQRYTQRNAELDQQFAAERLALEHDWSSGLARIRQPIGQDGLAPANWNDPSWEKWVPPTKFPDAVRFGELQIDPKQIIAEVAGESQFTLPLPDVFCVPALMAFPKQASVMFHAERLGRGEAVNALRMIMTRLLTSLPPGRVRFTLIDPVGLGQNFAGFMHLADYDDALVGGRIWTDSEHIDQRLANLTEHMETVIQKYLRNEFATIDDYNAQAGELAEPYRFLVIADFPVNFSDEAFRRLSSIASTGARCGVYMLIAHDTRIATGAGVHLDDVEVHSINLDRKESGFVWRDQIFSRFPLKLDESPNDEALTKLLHRVGEKAREAKRVEVPFDSIAPKPAQFWSLKSAADLQVAVGRSGATRLQTFRLGKGVAQHALIAGKTGSGKSTLLHALISNLSMWYSPDEVEMYLIDFKKGVEFKTYASHQLPQARAIAVESDREFGLSVLQRIDAEMARRGELFRKLGVQDLSGYRQASGQPMPRTLLIIDEFQEFFTEDDKLAQDAALLLDRIVRQGRAFGVHLILGSQTIGGASGLSRSTMGQIAVRIALQTSEADSHLILGDGNAAARLLSRPGEAIYNDAGGLVEGNSPFQVAWLPDERRDKYLEQVTARVRQTGMHPTPPIVFEGNAMADYTQNKLLMDLLASPKYQPMTSPPQIWLGEPVSIKSPTSISLRRQSGSNTLIIGQNEDTALALVSLAMVGLAAQLPADAISFRLLDGAPADSPSFGVLPRVAASLPHQTKVVDYRALGEAIHELAGEMHRRQDASAAAAPAIVLIIYGLQRYRALRKSEESFGFSASDEEKAADPSKEFVELMREGPAVGIHILAWIDTATALDRTLDRGSMREFDNRVLFQMSAADSSNLIDSPAANKLGVYRALAFSEEQGTMEKFRPYANPDAKFLAEVQRRLAAKSASIAQPAARG
jgi:hypothetical protein